MICNGFSVRLWYFLRKSSLVKSSAFAVISGITSLIFIFAKKSRLYTAWFNINIFFQATTEVFSAKLKIYQEIRNYYNEVINTHMARYMKDGLKNKISGNKDSAKQAEVGGVPQVTA